MFTEATDTKKVEKANTVAAGVLLAVGLPTSPMSQLPNVLVLVWALGLSIVMLRRTAGQEG